MDGFGRRGVEAWDSEDAATVARSPLFEPSSYASAAGIEGTAEELAQHYLSVGEPASLTPSSGFDPACYRQFYPDVARTGISPLLHYERHGRQENRYCSMAALRADAQRIEDSGLFDRRAYAWRRGRPPMRGLSDIEDYLIRRDTPAPATAGFDSDAYEQMYPGCLAGYAAPILHYLDVGMRQDRVFSREELARRKDLIRSRFNARFYLGQFPPDAPVDDPLEHYILEGARQGLAPAPDFCADYYTRRYPDLATMSSDLFLHFAAFGAAEGRVGRPDFTAITSRGKRAFEIDKPAILVTSHEASRTGAPLVALTIGDHLAATHNVIYSVSRGGPLLEAFREKSCLVVLGGLDSLDAEYLLRELRDTHGLSAVLLNSVETSPFARAALYAGTPSVALVHEFASYTFPPGRMTEVIESADRVVAPAALIRDSVQEEVERFRLAAPNNLAIRPQGCLPSLPEGDPALDMTRTDLLALIGAAPGKRVRVVLGDGFVHMRKGTDLFVQTAAELRKLPGAEDVRFIWVGGGYEPKTDLTYSAWVADMVRQFGLERTLFFLPPQSSLDALFELADVFFLPSRLDPFPNVVLDALRAGRGVVCFDRATGSAGLFEGEGAAVGAAAPYCDVAEAAQALVWAMRPAVVKKAERNRAFIAERFAFTDYVEALTDQMRAAQAERAALDAEVERIAASGLFDAAFHDGTTGPLVPGAERRSIQAYAARARKGLLLASPRPGFNEGVARLWLGADPALGRETMPDATHRCIRLDQASRLPPFTGRAALHLHLHYPELAAGFLEALEAGKSVVDLFVTTTSAEKRIEVAYALKGWKGGSVDVTLAPNRGRDLGPFLTEMGRIVRGGAYDVVGHMHGKRSLSNDPTMGDRWRAYLSRILLGGDAGVAGVLAPFEDDLGLGLLFAEDRHVVGWTRNRPAAEALAARMMPAPALPEWPVFPLGSMFWARPAALEPLFAMGLAAHDFPPEPLAEDGTMLHAIERLLPAVCESVGRTWCTVYRDGPGW